MGEKGRLHMRPDIVLEEPKYDGEKISRLEAFGDDDVDLDSACEENDTTDNASYGSGSDDDNDGNVNSDAGEDRRNDDAGEGQRNDEMQIRDEQYHDLRKQEEQILEDMRRQNKEDVEKGRAVSHQKALWDKGLEMRISLQKLLSHANQLPLEDARGELDNAEELKQAFTSLSSSAKETLDCLTQLQSALIAQNSEITSTSPGEINVNEVSSEGTLDSEWNRINRLYSRFLPYRDNSLDKWHRKVQISTGATAVKGRLRAFNQSISEQVAAVMKDPSRLINNMQLRKSLVDNEMDPETFDDSEFYQQLLREFLESADPNALGSMNLHDVKKIQSKKRKVVDRRASKGRKTRYNVHEAIVNFMAPEQMSLPPMATKLFANLFGNQSVVV